MAQPWPGMARTIHNNHQRFIETYFQPYPAYLKLAILNIPVCVISVPQFAKRLPKTRSGKIMRRVLRKVVECDLDGLGDLSTLDDPGAVQEILKGHEKLLSKKEPLQ
ncbi:hypothetical protein XENOCAPTIV_028602 [Xenoophorus captivus]|uniref:AMP-binding enzyme C-terminal domain-containing protein n=1 Tax=Xenoophorus captivus TaxID=1517983 RepID=A0ABV0QX34_9TELE